MASDLTAELCLKWHKKNKRHGDRENRLFFRCLQISLLYGIMEENREEVHLCRCK